MAQALQHTLTHRREARALAPAVPPPKDYAPRAASVALPTRPMTDYTLLVAIVALLVLGLVMVFSASQYASPADPGYWFRRQLVWAALGLVALFVTSRVHYRSWRRLAFPGMLLAVALLVAVVLVGNSAYGAQRWLYVGISIQPSELAKLALAIYIADWLVRKGDEVRSLLYGLVPFAALTGTVLALILMQNDLGTSLVVAGMSFALFFTAGARVLQLLPTFALGGLGAFALSMGTAFRRARIAAFLHPLSPGCSDAVSYQVCQGLVSLGSGGIFGRGLGDGVQKAGYLPNPFTDSIFAVTGEELGLLGCAVILGLFAVVALRGYRAGRRAPDGFGALLACAVTTWLVVQAAINIGSVTAAIPFSGVPLPFVSFGGSSLVTSLAAVGILLNISAHGGVASATEVDRRAYASVPLHVSHP